MTISPFEPSRCSEVELGEWYDTLVAATRAESPDAALPTYEAYAELARRPVGTIGPRLMWCARDGALIRGTAVASFPDKENGHLAVVSVHVHPDGQRRGVGTALLEYALPAIEDRGRSVVFGGGLKVGSTGQLWAASLGFRGVQECLWMVLRPGEVDPAIWAVDVPPGFRTQQWTESAPESLIEAYAHARTAIEDAPTGESTMTNPQWTAERVRQSEQEGAAAGEERRVVAAVHEESGAVAAITEVAWRPSRPEHCAQRDTAVLPAFRGCGLGVFVKASMMRWLIAEHPEIEQVMTSNAADNEHMIRVNRKIGYVPYRHVTNVEADVEGLKSSLARRAGSH